MATAAKSLFNYSGDGADENGCWLRSQLLFAALAKPKRGLNMVNTSKEGSHCFGMQGLWEPGGLVSPGIGKQRRH
jgi:hypothetical protein